MHQIDDSTLVFCPVIRHQLRPVDNVSDRNEGTEFVIDSVTFREFSYLKLC